MLYNSLQVRVFNIDGFLKEKLLLLKYLDDSNIESILLKIKTLLDIINLEMKIIDINKFLNEFFLDINLVLFNEENEKLKTFLLKKFLIFHFLHFYSIFIFRLPEDYLKQTIFKLLDSKSLKIVKKNYISFNYKKKKFLKNFSNNYIKRINNLKLFSKKKSFFIIGNAFAFYKGSISPFYGSKFSWFIETGLKSDVECSNIEINPFYVEAQNLTKLKPIVLKINDFKKKIDIKIKKQVRHLFLYKLYNLWGLKRFISEANSSFNYKQNYNSLFSQFFFFYKVKLNFLYKFLYKKFNLTFIILNLKNFIFKNFLNLNINLIKNKFIFMIFSISKNFLNFYMYFNDEINYNSKKCNFFYKNLFFFVRFCGILIKFSKNIFSVFFKNTFRNNYLLSFNKKLINFSIKFKLFINFLNCFNLHFFFIKNISKYISKKSFFDMYFDIFLMKKKRQIFLDLLKNEEKNLSFLEIINYQTELLKKPYWNTLYKFFLYYFYFLLDWKRNFDYFLLKKYDNFSSYYFLIDLLKPFKKLKKKWHVNSFLDIKELYFFFFEFLEETNVNIKKIFYITFYKNINIDYKFLLSNLYLYFYKMLYKFSNNDLFSLSLNKSISFSCFFLGRWFYYNNSNKLFLNNNIDYNYNFSFFNYKSSLNFSFFNLNYYKYKININNSFINSFFLDTYFENYFVSNIINNKEKKNINKTEFIGYNYIRKNLVNDKMKKKMFGIFFKNDKKIYSSKVLYKFYNYSNISLRKSISSSLYLKENFNKLTKLRTRIKRDKTFPFLDKRYLLFYRQRLFLKDYYSYKFKFAFLESDLVLFNMFLLLFKTNKSKVTIKKSFSFYNFWFIFKE